MTRGPAVTEKQLRDALDALATGVRAAPDAYRQAQAQWRRRERRRRLTLAILVAIVFTVAVLIGLFVLNRAQDGSHIIFDDRPRVEQSDPAQQVVP
jgi:type VI protein secretion system component VasF